MKTNDLNWIKQSDRILTDQISKLVVDGCIQSANTRYLTPGTKKVPGSQNVPVKYNDIAFSWLLLQYTQIQNG